MEGGKALMTYDLETSAERILLTSDTTLADPSGIGAGLVFASESPVLPATGFGPMRNLFTCGEDGRFPRRLTWDLGGNADPQVFPDGRILYVRREGLDQGKTPSTWRGCLFTMNPDGSNQSMWYDPRSAGFHIQQARPIPGSESVVAVVAGSPSEHGILVRIDAELGRRDGLGVRRWDGAPLNLPTTADFGLTGDVYRDPIVLPDGSLVAAWRRVEAGSPPGPFAIVQVDAQGQRRVLLADATASFTHPVPILPRPVPHRRPASIDLRSQEAFLYVQDIYAGSALPGMVRGSVKSLRVVAYDLPPAAATVALEGGAATPRAVLGEVPVAADGSAFLTVPAQVPLTVQALGQDGKLIQTMRSWVTLQRGERLSCVGCHDHPNHAPLRTTPSAFRAAPATLAAGLGRQPGFSFTKQVQPILDRHCANCHGLPRPTPTARFFSVAPNRAPLSDALRSLDDLRWAGPALTAGPMPLEPSRQASAASPLMAMLTKGHEGVHLSREEFTTLATWFDLGRPTVGDAAETLTTLTGEAAEAYRTAVERRAKAERDERAQLQEILLHQYGHE